MNKDCDDHVMVVIVETDRGLAIVPFEVDPPNDDEFATSRTITPTINASLLASLRGLCRNPDVSGAILVSLTE